MPLPFWPDTGGGGKGGAPGGLPPIFGPGGIFGSVGDIIGNIFGWESGTAGGGGTTPQSQGQGSSGWQGGGLLGGGIMPLVLIGVIAWFIFRK